MKEKTSRPCFSCGTEAAWWIERNCDRCYKSEREDAASKPDNKIEPFDEFAGLTDFERTLADICIGWIGKEIGWKQYIKDNADVLLRIVVGNFNSVQDVPFEQKPVSSATFETKEVDLEKECKTYFKNNFTSKEAPDEFLTTQMQLDDMVLFAKHFFELGLKTRKED